MSDEPRSDLPKRRVPGLELISCHAGHLKGINELAWSPDGKSIATASDDGLVRISHYCDDHGKIELRHTKDERVLSVAWSPDGSRIATGCSDGKIRLWAWRTGQLIEEITSEYIEAFTLAWSTHDILAIGGRCGRLFVIDNSSGCTLRLIGKHHDRGIRDVAWSPDNSMIASASSDHTVRVWDPKSGKECSVLEGHLDAVNSVTWTTGGSIFSGSDDGTVRQWDVAHGREKAVIEAHGGMVNCVRVSRSGHLLFTKAEDSQVRIWNTETLDLIAALQETTAGDCLQGIDFCPVDDFVATRGDKDRAIRVWSLDESRLLSPKTFSSTVRHATARVVILGDAGTGKTSLAWRLCHKEHRIHPPTHGAQFWIPQDMTSDVGGARREVILWDLAGQPAYRLIHTLHIDQANIALITLDPFDPDPLNGPLYWLRALSKVTTCTSILTITKVDCIDPSRLEELRALCEKHAPGHICMTTSAATGHGMETLKREILSLIEWDAISAHISLESFKEIRRLIIEQKSTPTRRAPPLLMKLSDVRSRLIRHGIQAEVTLEDIRAAAFHLANYGYIHLLDTPDDDEPTILLRPELINNLAQSCVLQAGRDRRGLGTLDERKLYENEYRLPELEDLEESDRRLLAHTTVAGLIRHDVCFRGSLPEARELLIFPALIDRVRTHHDRQDRIVSVRYQLENYIENLYSVLVVLIGHTMSFARPVLWSNEAEFESSGGAKCGFQHLRRSADVSEYEIYYSKFAPPHIHMMFQGIFESILIEQGASGHCIDGASCSKCNCSIPSMIIRWRFCEGKSMIRCPDCGASVGFESSIRRIGKCHEEESLVKQERDAAELRKLFSVTIAQIQGLFSRRAIRPTCFISYAWGDPEHEAWVEERLATDLLEAGIDVKLDRWHNTNIGQSIPRFIASTANCEWIIVVGTERYRQKYEASSTKKSTVSAEFDVIGSRLLGTEQEKSTVLPIVVDDDPELALPPQLLGRVHATLGPTGMYYSELLKIIITMYGLSLESSRVRQIQNSLTDKEKEFLRTGLRS